MLFVEMVSNRSVVMINKSVRWPQRRPGAGPTSTTVGRHRDDVGSSSRVPLPSHYCALSGRPACFGPFSRAILFIMTFPEIVVLFSGCPAIAELCSIISNKVRI